jgi:SAM-dependent methyltransferase
MINSKSALEAVMRLFPFPGYIPEPVLGRSGHLDLADTVLKYLPTNASILDFGSGPCDKTAVLQRLGYRCSAWDDLQDDWHKLPGNTEKIVDFSRQSGVDLHIARGGAWPFQPDSFDMVVVHHVLEHLHSSPRELLNDLLGLCKPGGFLLAAVPNAVNLRKRLHVLFGRTNYPQYPLYYWYPGPWRGHIREYVRDDLRLLAEFLGLETKELRGADHMLYRLPGLGARPYLWMTDVFDGLKDSWTLVAKKPIDWQPKTLSRSEIDVILGGVTSFRY